MCCIHRLLLTPAHNPYINVGVHDDRNIGSALTTAIWFHIVMVGEDVGANRTGRVYVNGVEVAGSPQNFAGNLLDSSALNTWIGTGELGTAHLLRGALDEVQIYQGALTPIEVARLYATGSASVPQIPAQGPLGLFITFLGLAVTGVIVLKG